MTALNLVSLVLRGVAVLRDSVNVELRLGTSYKAGTETPEIPFSMRHPSQGYKQEPNGNPADRQVHIADVTDADSGAGRSLGLAGVLSRSTPTTFVGRTALRQSVANGASVISTLASPASLAKTATTLSHPTSSRFLVNSNARLSAITGDQPASAETCRSEVGEAWCKPATRTPPASTWGRGNR